MNMGNEQRIAKQDEEQHSEVVERRLWSAVLLQAVQDLRFGNFRQREAAEKFFLESSADLETVCRGAGFEPSYVLRKIEKMRTPLRRPADPIAWPMRYNHAVAHAA